MPKPKRTLLLFMLLAIGMMVCAQPLWARPRADEALHHDHCSCAYAAGTVQSAFSNANAVFTGTVTEMAAPNDTPAYIEWAQSLPGVEWRGFSVWRISLAVGDSWKGVTTNTVTVRTQFGVDCGYHFASGGQYLIYAQQGRDGLETNVCTRTSELAASADLTFLQTQPKLKLSWSPSQLIFPGLAVLTLLVLAMMTVRWVRREAVSFEQ